MLRRRSRDRRNQKPREAAPAPAAPKPPGKRRAREGSTVPDSLRFSMQRPSPSDPRPTPYTAVVLVTGFDCFGGEALNPSWEICRQLPREIGGMRIETCLLPCEFRRSIEVAAEAIERHKPSIVLSVGQAGGRSRLGVERVAINVDDARIPDNAGFAPVDEAIASNGPPAYFATLPVKAMARAIRAEGIPAEVSNSAGTYVCNHVMYGVLHFLAASGHKARSGFIHVPFAESQVLDKKDVPAMAMDSMVRGIHAAIAAAIAHREDIAVAEGALD
jgi:pyroglutamyl-peptidase